MMREIELKILLDEDGADRLRAALAAETGEGKPRAQALHAIYHDTPGRALAARLIALRVRREGRRWVQTAKMGGALSAGLSTPLETESPAPGGRVSVEAIPDPDIRAAVADAIGADPLEPVCETDIRRVKARLSGPFGGVVEIAVDEGAIRAGGAAEPIREAELELVSGDPRDVYAVAKRLFSVGPIRFSRRTKAQRGFDLSRGMPAVNPLPPVVMAADIRLNPSQTTETAAAAVLRGCMDQIAANVAAAAASDEPEGPHQLRVGLRRLRTAASALGPVIGGPALDALDAEARALATDVGAVRDLDVLSGEMLAPLALRDAGFGRLLDALRARAEAARAAMRARLADGRTVGFVFDLGSFVEGRGWLRPADFEQTAELARPVIDTAGAAIEKRWRKCVRLADRIDELSIEERHELRKALKKLRYSVEFFASLYPAKKVAPFIKRLKALQDDFGALQDLAMAEAALCGADAPGADDPLAQRAVGYALGRWEAQAEHDWARAKAHWAALADAKRFWR
jgi:inorganic triphosphatase YgiF